MRRRSGDTLVALIGGAYQARNVIASSQRCVNLYPEINPPDSGQPVPVTHYLTPGLTLLAPAPAPSAARGGYTASTGELFVCVGPNIYLVSPTWGFTFIGAIADATTPVSMADNGLALVIVDGSANGYAVNMATKVFAPITGAAFYGADRAGFLDTYFIFNRPKTIQFYISLSLVSYAMLTGGTAFDPLDIASKAGAADAIQSILVKGRELWLFGKYTTEVWINNGAADFTFEQLPGTAIDHGCAAKYSIARHDVYGFWIAQDKEGGALVVRTEGYAPVRISTHAIEAEIQSYATVADAIGFCFQQQGHAFYVMTFPTANRTWAYEIKTGQWHELASFDGNGQQNRHRANCGTFAYGQNVIGDWQTGSLFALDPNVYTENGNPILRIRTFPHMVNNGNRVTYKSFLAYMQTGTALGAPADDDSRDSDSPPGEPQISLRWSDTGGASWGNPVMQSMGGTGQYKTQIQWQRLGMARDRVFEISWSAPVKTALNGAFIEMMDHAS